MFAIQNMTLITQQRSLLAISHQLEMEAMNIAEAIARTCSQNPEISAQWQAKAFGKGWLNIYLNEQYIAENLFALDIWQPNKSDISIDFPDKSPEPICQYAYARCCALIRLADRENLLASQPKIVSGLEPTEISLLLQNLAIASCIENFLIIDRYKLSRSLAEVFCNFTIIVGFLECLTK